MKNDKIIKKWYFWRKLYQNQNALKTILFSYGSIKTSFVISDVEITTLSWIFIGKFVVFPRFFIVGIFDFVRRYCRLGYKNAELDENYRERRVIFYFIIYKFSLYFSVFPNDFYKKLIIIRMLIWFFVKLKLIFRLKKQ